MQGILKKEMASQWFTSQQERQISKQVITSGHAYLERGSTEWYWE